MNEQTNAVGFLQQTAVAPNTMLGVESDKAVAEVKAMAALAHARPRDEARAVDKVLNACTRPTLAESARYTYTRGGTEITGPTIRLAEAIAQYWGNISWGWKEIERRLDTSVCRAYAWDVENNVRREADFIVPHYRDTKHGRKALKDDRDIYEVCANMAMRRVRACLLNVIPADVVEMAEKACDATLASGEPVTDESRKRLLEAFAGYGVTRAMIEKRLGRSLDAMTPGQQVSLRRVYAGLKDGMGVVADYFTIEEPVKDEVKKPSKGIAAVKNAIKPKVEEQVAAQNQEAAQSVLEPDENLFGTLPELPPLTEEEMARYDAEQEAAERAAIEDEQVAPHFLRGENNA